MAGLLSRGTLVEGNWNLLLNKTSWIQIPKSQTPPSRGKLWQFRNSSQSLCPTKKSVSGHKVEVSLAWTTKSCWMPTVCRACWRIPREEKMWALPLRNFSVHLKQQNKRTFACIKQRCSGPAAPRQLGRKSGGGAGVQPSIDSAIRRQWVQTGLDSLLFAAIRTFWTRFLEP